MNFEKGIKKEKSSTDVKDVVYLEKKMAEIDEKSKELEREKEIIKNELDEFNEYMTAENIREELRELPKISLTVAKRAERERILENKLAAIKEKPFAVITWEAEKGDGYHCPACSTDTKIVAMCANRRAAEGFMETYNFPSVGEIDDSRTHDKMARSRELERRWGKYFIRNLLEEE